MHKFHRAAKEIVTTLTEYGVQYKGRRKNSETSRVGQEVKACRQQSARLRMNAGQSQTGGVLGAV